MDRTGELSGAFYQGALNWTYAAALAYDETIEPRNISSASQNALQWYCYFLRATTEPWRSCEAS